MSTFRRTAVALAATMIAASTAALAYGTGPVAAASAVVQPTDNALAVAQAIAADPGVVVGAAWVARSHDPLEGDGPTGIVTAPVTGFPTAGQTAAILTTGDATIIDSPNDSGGSGAANSGPNVRGDTDYDVAILRIDLNVPAGVNCLSTSTSGICRRSIPSTSTRHSTTPLSPSSTPTTRGRRTVPTSSPPTTSPSTPPTARSRSTPQA